MSIKDLSNNHDGELAIGIFLLFFGLIILLSGSFRSAIGFIMVGVAGIIGSEWFQRYTKQDYANKKNILTISSYVLSIVGIILVVFYTLKSMI